MTKRIEFDDDGEEWIDVNKRVADAVVEKAMSEDLTFGVAFSQYVSENLTSGDGDN